MSDFSSDCEENEPRMLIYVEALTGTVFEMLVSPSDTVLSVKNKIQHDEGIPVNQIHLILGERELSNAKLLEEEGVTNLTTIKLMLGMRGGPISTRRSLTSRREQIWSRLLASYESNREAVTIKVNPPEAMVTYSLLVYREGDAINFLKVVENIDGSYSSVSDVSKSASSSAGTSRSNRHTSKSHHHHSSSSRTPLRVLARTPMRTPNDPEKLKETLREHKELTTKMNDLRQKMQAMSLRKKNRKKNKNELPLDDDETLTAPTLSLLENNEFVTPKCSESDNIVKAIPAAPKKIVTKYKTASSSGKMFKVKKCSMTVPKSIDTGPPDNKINTGKSKVKEWLNSDYYDDDEDVEVRGSLPTPVGYKKKIKSSKHYFKSNTHYNLRPHRHHRHSKTSSSSTEGGENIATTTAPTSFHNTSLLSDDEDDDIFNEFNFEIYDDDVNKKYNNKMPTSTPLTSKNTTTPISSYTSLPRLYESFLVRNKSAVDNGGTGDNEEDCAEVRPSTSRDQVNKKYKLKTTTASTTPKNNSSITSISYLPRVYDMFWKIAVDSGGTGDGEEDYGDIRPGTSRDNVDNLESTGAAVEFQQAIGHHRKQRLDESTRSSGEDDDDEEINTTCTSHVHEASSIAILEEEPESSVVNGDESPEFNASANEPISIPSPDANTFTISQIPRERSFSKNLPRNRIRVARLVLKEDDEHHHRPKSTPDKLSRELCDFLLNQDSDSKKSRDEERKERRSKFLSTSNSQLEKINSIKVALSNQSWGSQRGGASVTSSGESTSWSSRGGDQSRVSGSLLKPCYESHIIKVSKVDNYSGISNKSFYDASVVAAAGSASTSKSSELNNTITRNSRKSSIEHLPNIDLKNVAGNSGGSSTTGMVKVRVNERVRCKKCNKKLTIATIYECRCGDKFCSQHRYSEVHGCKFDYKTEGRRLIEQANPLVLAPKLPKI